MSRNQILLVFFEEDITKTVTDNSLIEKFTAKSPKLILKLCGGPEKGRF